MGQTTRKLVVNSENVSITKDKNQTKVKKKYSKLKETKGRHKGTYWDNDRNWCMNCP